MKRTTLSTLLVLCLGLVSAACSTPTAGVAPPRESQVKPAGSNSADGAPVDFSTMQAEDMSGPAAKAFGAANVALGLQQFLSLHYNVFWNTDLMNYDEMTPKHVKALLNSHTTPELANLLADDVATIRTLVETDGDVSRANPSLQRIFILTGWATYGVTPGIEEPADSDNRSAILSYDVDPIKTYASKSLASPQMRADFAVTVTTAGVAADGKYLHTPVEGTNIPVQREWTQKFQVGFTPGPAFNNPEAAARGDDVWILNYYKPEMSETPGWVVAP